MYKRQTIYRRFANRDEVVMAVNARASIPVEPVDTGSLHGDIRAFIGHLAKSVSHRREHIVEALNAGSVTNPELDRAMRAKFIEPRLLELRGILARAKARGELTSVPSTEVAASIISGPSYHRAFVLRLPLTPKFLATATTLAVDGLRAAAPRAR